MSACRRLQPGARVPAAHVALAALAATAALLAFAAPASAQTPAPQTQASQTPAPQTRLLQTRAAQSPSLQTPAPQGLPAASAAPTLDANEIYDRARAAAYAARLPAFLSYETHATFARKGKIKAEHFRVVMRTADAKSYVTPLPDSPRDRLDTTPRVQDAPPYLSPFNTFGLIERKAGEKPSRYEAPGTPAPAASGPPVIGSVTVTARPYDISLLGIETLGSRSVYHLVLHPVRDPVHRRLRELFVATDTYRLERAVIQAYGAAGPLHTRPLVTIDYAPAGDAQAIVRISVDVTLRAFFFAYGGHGEFRAEQVTTPSAAPDWMFDAALLAEHERALRATTPP